jgi:glycine C-acetyltransferase
MHYKTKRNFNIGDTNTCVTPVYLEGSVPEAMIMVNEDYGIFSIDSNLSCNSKGIILLRMIYYITYFIRCR